MKKIIYLLVLINLFLYKPDFVFSQIEKNIYLDTSSQKYNRYMY
jgi:hypothetical protein